MTPDEFEALASTSPLVEFNSPIASFQTAGPPTPGKWYYNRGRWSPFVVAICFAPRTNRSGTHPLACIEKHGGRLCYDVWNDAEAAWLPKAVRFPKDLTTIDEVLAYATTVARMTQ